MSQRISESKQILRYPVRLILFLSSYVPLFFIIALRLGASKPFIMQEVTISQIQFEFVFSWVSTALVLFCLGISIVLYRVMSIYSGSATTKKIINSYQRRNELLSMYLLSYVFVFAGLMFSNPIDIAVFTVFFIVLAILQIRSDILHVNPMLGLKGYYTYEITSGNQIVLVISKGPVEEKMILPEKSSEPTEEDSNTKIELVPLGGNTYLAP